MALVISFFLATVLFEHLGNFAPTTRTALFYSLVAVCAVVVGRFIIIPITKIYRIGNRLSHKEAAAIIGTHFTNVQDKLLNILELKELSASSSSNDLVLAGISQKSAELEPLPFQKVIDLSSNKKYLKYALPPLLLMAFLYAWNPSVITSSTHRLVNHSEEFLPVAPFNFKVLNPNLETVRQNNFVLEVNVSGESIPSSVFVVENGQRIKMSSVGGGNFRYVFNNIIKTKTFRLFGAGFYSEEFTLTVLPKPTLLNFSINCSYPSYLNKESQTIFNTGDLVIPEGTKLKWEFNTQDVDYLSLALGDSTYSLEQSKKNVYTAQKTIFSGLSYFVLAGNEFTKNNDTIIYSIGVIKDQYPSISVNEKADSIVPKLIYFSGTLKDDYQVSQLSFNYRLNSKSGSVKADFITENVSINKEKVSSFFHVWNMAEIKLNPGDEITYYFEVWDNDGVNGRKSTKSKTAVFKAPTLEELAQKEDQANDKLKEDLKESKEIAKELQEDVKKLKQKLMEKKELSWQEKQELKQLLDKQKTLENELNNMKNEHLQNANEQSEYKEQEERMVEKQEKIQELFDEVLTEEMKEMYRELEEMMEKMNKEDLLEKLEDIELSNDDIEKELDRTLELFKQMEFEQKLEEATAKLEELKEEQDKLKEETENKESDTEELKEKQEELNKKFDELKDEMADLEKKNEELEFSNDMPDTEEEQNKASEEMQNSEEQLDQKKKKKASESQQNASDQMQEMIEKMKQFQQEMEEQAQTEDIDDLRQLLENLIQLSFDQEDLMARVKGLTKKDPAYFDVGKQQKKLKDDAKMIEDSLFALSKRVPEIESTVNRQIADINANMEKALKMVHERQTAQLMARQQYIMTAVNNLALLLDEAIQQMQQQQAQQKFGEGSCSKPGSSSSPKPGQMKKMQQKISQQLEQMKQEMEGKSPGGKKPNGQKGQGGMSKKLAQLAAEQEALRNELQKLSEKMGEGGEGGSKGRGNGNLDKLAELMEENEKDIVNKQITQETLKRQEEILTRLLEHENAEQEREYDEKRKANEAKNQKFSNPEEFLEYKKLKQKEAEMLRTVSPQFTDFYKNKVTEYFNSIE